MKQLIIHTKDVAAIKGISPDTARRLLRVIKDAYGKQEHQCVTIREFCDYEGIPFDEVFAMINGLPYSPQKSA